jgi:hypothetical protein
MTSVVISQPQLFPWSGFFELFAAANIYLHLDDALFSRGGFLNRVQIKHLGGSKWMTVPARGLPSNISAYLANTYVPVIGAARLARA